MGAGGRDDDVLIDRALLERAPELVAAARAKRVEELEATAPPADSAWRAEMWSFLERSRPGGGGTSFMGGPAWEALRAAIHRDRGWPEGALLALADGLRSVTRHHLLEGELREAAAHRRDRGVDQGAGERGQWHQRQRIRDAAPLIEELAKVADALAKQLGNPLIRSQVRRVVLHRAAIVDPESGRTRPQTFTVEDVLTGELSPDRGRRAAVDELDARVVLLRVLTAGDGPFALSFAHAAAIASDVGPRFVPQEAHPGLRNPWTVAAVTQAWSRGRPAS